MPVRVPLRSAKIAKLVPTSANHMVTSSIAFDGVGASWTCWPFLRNTKVFEVVVSLIFGAFSGRVCRTLAFAAGDLRTSSF